MQLIIRPRDERGAVLVHAAVVLLALTAFTALVFDLGVMFVSRGQAQNAADAGALAAAVSLAFVDGSNQALAKNSAIETAQQNQVWGEAPGIGGGDVTFFPAAACPPGASGQGTCVRVNVFRTSYQGGGGTPLPTFFANIVGLGEQGTRATATAQVMARSGTADCVKPWAIPDRWTENNEPIGPTNTFSRYLQPGPGLVPTPDAYIPPGPGIDGTGFTLPGDLGRQLQLQTADAAAGLPASANALYPVRLLFSPTPYAAAIAEPCGNSTENIVPGVTLLGDGFGTAAATIAGASDLIGQDPGATWDAAANGGLGAPTGGCMAAGTCTRSPRLVAAILFNPDIYDAGRLINPSFSVTKIVGLWVESVAGGAVIGYLTAYPSVSLTGPVYPQPSSFVRTVVMIR